MQRFHVLVTLTALFPTWASGATASGVYTFHLLSGSDAALLPQRQNAFAACQCGVAWTSEGEYAKCPPWWQWIWKFADNSRTGIGVDLQALSVLNQSPGGQHSYLSSDVSVNVLLRDCKLYKWECISLCDRQCVITLMHEPALGIIRSMHFRDPSDATGTPTQTPNITIHPLLDAQFDIFNLTINHKECPEPLVEFKLTAAPQIDLYGRFTRKDAQVQLPIQPNIEWHFTKQGSLVLQVSIPAFTVGGRNPPASFAIGFVWHAVNNTSEPKEDVCAGDQ